MADWRSSEAGASPTLPNLAGLLSTANLPRQGRVLALGGGAATQKLLAPIVVGTEGPIFVVDPEAGEASARAERAGSDMFTAALPRDIDLAVAMPALVRLPDAAEGLLYDGIYDALRDGGIVALLFPRDVTDRTLISMGAMTERVRKGLQSFLAAHFGAETIDDPERIRSKFEGDSFYECIDIATRGKGVFSAEPLVWLVLRKRAGPAPEPGAKATTRGLPRSQRADQFSMAELRTFIVRLRHAGIPFVPVDKFAERYAAYVAIARKARRKYGTPTGHMKFDIHGNVHRALEIAQMLHKMRVPALFLMMHRHPLNQEFFDAPSTWKMLHDIEDMGHEIGMHADPFCLIRESGDFHVGLAKALAELRGRGFAIRAMSLHGDTREHIKARQLQANDFFSERYRRSKWDGLPPQGEEALAQHVHRYSYQWIAENLGIEFFSEVNFLHMGKLMFDEPMLYVSDNARAIRISSIPKSVGPEEQITAPQPFVIDLPFIKQAVSVLKQRPFLALFHPQWYW